MEFQSQKTRSDGVLTLKTLAFSFFMVTKLPFQLS